MYINLNHAFDNRIELPEELLASAKSKRYAKGDILYNKGDGSQNLVYIKSGIVGLVDLSSGGHESLLRVFGDHFLLGYRSFLAKESYHATAMGLTDGELLLFPYQTPEELLEKLPKLYMHIGQMLARDLRIAEERFNDITGKRVMSRIIESLIFLKHRHPSYQWTRREIGEFCGAKTETVTRALTKLEGLGLIKKEGREIVIPDTESLLNFSENVV